MDGTAYALNSVGGACPTTPNLVGPEILLFTVKILHFKSFGRTNNCQVEILLEWSDKSCPLSASPVEVIASLRISPGFSMIVT